jgi:beta-lactamase superfamily II metal-dependent hydrolase
MIPSVLSTFNQIVMGNIQFIGYPEAPIYKENPDVANKKEIAKWTLWGDYVKLLNGSSLNYQEVHCRDADGWVEKKLLQSERVLEVNFIDVGQGDGCFIVVPDINPEKDRFILVDAGVSSNMSHFLNWRFNFKGNNFNLPIEYLIITHPDADHFMGFKEIINNNRCLINKIYHNGIVPRAGKDKFGKTTQLDGKTYLQDVITDQTKLSALINVPQNLENNDFLNLMKDALTRNNANNFIEMLEYGMKIPGYSNGDLTFEVLGPVSVTDSSNNKLLPSFGGDGPTKNGNSIVLKLTYKNVKIFLSGDLNKKSQEYLVEFYLQKAGIVRNKNDRGYIDYINSLRGILQSDVTKSNHHGSNDFLYEFLQFINPIATVISSGDNETFVHPRPDTLGVIGKTSRGVYPLIFSTELARSANDNKYNDDLKKQILEQEAKLVAETDLKKVQSINKTITKAVSKLQRNIAVYGMITLRSDGDKVIIAQKKEKKGAGFQIYKLLPNKNGELAYLPK